MSYPPDKLATILQSIQHFVGTRIQLNPVYQEIYQELEKGKHSFNSRKLLVKIFGTFSIPASGLCNFFRVYQALPQFYQVEVSEIPTISQSAQSNSFPLLILKANPAIGQRETRYELFSKGSILVGRDYQRLSQDFRSQNAQVIALSSYSKLSSVHAQIQPTQNSTDWQVCDINSTNGTYINGQRIKGCKTLKSGDTITLAYPAASEKAPEFVFEGQISNPIQASSHITSITGDLLFIVINPKQGLSNSEKQLIEQISKTQIVGFIIVADISGTSQQDNQPINANLAAIQSWVQVQHPQLAQNLEIVALTLHPFYPNIPPSPLPPTIEQQFAQFCEPLITLAKTQGEAIVAKRIGDQLQAKLQRIEKVINTQEEALNTEIRRTEAILQGRTLEYWREYLIRATKQVSEEREEFFREARTEFSRARIDFGSDFIPNNLMQKIEDFVRSLDPVVTKLQGDICIQLQPHNRADLHQTILQFCQAELTQWGNQQWERIRYVPHTEGLEGLLRKSYTQLNCLPGFQLTNTFNQPPAKLGFYNSLNISFVEVKADISYSESSGDAFGGIAKIAMLTASTAVGISMGSPYALIQGASVVSALTGFIGGSLSRPQQQQLKLEQVIDSLRRNTCSHYQKIARYLLDRVAQEIVSAIDTAERGFRKSLEGFDEQFRGYFKELETISGSYRVRQQTLHQDKLAFEQIKRLSG